MFFLSVFRRPISPTRNLQRYLAEAILPEMFYGPFDTEPHSFVPSSDYRSSNDLSVNPETYRALETIRRFKDEWFNDSCRQFVDHLASQIIPNTQDEDEETGGRITIACGPRFNVPPLKLIRPNNMIRLAALIDQLPLATAQRIHHITYSDTNWRFYEEQGDSDDDIFRHFSWSGRTEDGSMKTSLVVAVQPPWVLTEDDLQRLSCAEAYCPNLVDLAGERVHSTDRLWAKLWDLCLRKTCQYFILTTYDYWLFGGFSGDRAFISHPKPWDGKTPTIIQSLVFWLASSMGKDDSYPLPPVPEPNENSLEYEDVPQAIDDSYQTHTPTPLDTALIAPATPRKRSPLEGLPQLRFPGTSPARRMRPQKHPRSATMPLTTRFHYRLANRRRKMEAVAASARVASTRSSLPRSPGSKLSASPSAQRFDRFGSAARRLSPSPSLDSSPPAYSRFPQSPTPGPSSGGTWTSGGSPDDTAPSYAEQFDTYSSVRNRPPTPYSNFLAGVHRLDGPSTSDWDSFDDMTPSPSSRRKVAGAASPSRRNVTISELRQQARDIEQSATDAWLGHQEAWRRAGGPYYVTYPLVRDVAPAYADGQVRGVARMETEHRVLAWVGMNTDHEPIELDSLQPEEEIYERLPSLLDRWSDADSYRVEDDHMSPEPPEGTFLGHRL